MNLQPVYENIEKRCFRYVTKDEIDVKVKRFFEVLQPLLLLTSESDNARTLSDVVIRDLIGLEHQREAEAKEIVEKEAKSLASTLLASYRNLLPHNGTISIQYVDFVPQLATISRKNSETKKVEVVATLN